MKRTLSLLLLAMPVAVISASASGACNLCNPLVSSLSAANAVAESNDTVVPISFTVPDIVDVVESREDGSGERAQAPIGLAPEYEAFEACKPIPKMVVEEKDGEWYAEQAQAWYKYASLCKTDEEAWRTCFIVTRYANMCDEMELTTEEVIGEIEKNIPDTYTYYYAKYRDNNNYEELKSYATKAIALLPDHPTLDDLDTWVCYYAIVGDESGLERIAKLHNQLHPYPEMVMTHAIEELNSMDAKGIVMCRSDLESISKLLAVYGMGVHRDKVVMVFDYLNFPEYVKSIYKKCGVKKVPKVSYDFTTYDEYYGTLCGIVNDLSKRSKRSAYFALNEGRDFGNFFDCTIEGLLVKVGKDDVPDLAKIAENWRKVYKIDSYLTPMADDVWRCEEVARSIMVSIAANLSEDMEEVAPDVAASMNQVCEYYKDYVDSMNESDEESDDLGAAMEQFANEMYEAYASFAADYEENNVTSKDSKATADEPEEEGAGVYSTLKFLFEGAGKSYDPAILKAFVEMLGEMEPEESEE